MNKSLTKGGVIESLAVSKNYAWLETTNEFIHIPSERLIGVSDEVKVDVYEDRVRTWFLDHALELLRPADVHTAYNADGDYVALSIAVAYIEGVEQYRRGNHTPDKQSARWFQKSAGRIFPTATEGDIKKLYPLVRCGLFHSGFTKGPVYLSRQCPTAVETKHGKFRINPRLFVESVVEDFRVYVKDLRENSSGVLRRNFIKAWNEQWKNS